LTYLESDVGYLLGDSIKNFSFLLSKSSDKLPCEANCCNSVPVSLFFLIQWKIFVISVQLDFVCSLFDGPIHLGLDRAGLAVKMTHLLSSIQNVLMVRQTAATKMLTS